MYCHILLLRYFVPATISSVQTGWHLFDIMYCLIFVSFPLFGLMADVWIGRHKTIITGIILCFSSMIIAGIGYVLNSFYPSKAKLWPAYGMAYVLEVVGYCSFKANIVQYNIDQIIGASSSEISALVYCHSAGIPIVFSLFELGRCLIDHRYILLLTLLLSGVAASLVLVSHSLFKHHLENISLIKNPIKLIARVLCYAWKHKYPRNRSALTYWEEETPSRLDLGKEKYGGPFTEEEVEDVKTAFRILPLFMVTFSLAVTDEVYHWIFTGVSDIRVMDCFVSTQFVKFLTTSFLLLLYLLVIRLICRRYIPNILTLLTIGQVFAFLTLLCKFSVLFLYPDHLTLNLPYSSTMLFLPQVLHAFTFAFIFPASLEFTIAQSPVHMRGVMVGIKFAAMGFGFLFNINIKYLFGCENHYLCTNYYYYLTKASLVFVVLTVFAILAKRYKYRVRENEVNIHQIVDDHYQRYMEQEEEYNAQH